VKKLGFLLMLMAGLFSSCLSLSGNLTVNTAQRYTLTLNYSVKNEFSRIKYLGDNSSVMVLPLSFEEWQLFAESHGDVFFETAYYQIQELGSRTEIRARITFSDVTILEDLLSCNVALEGSNPYRLTLTFDKGSGNPSEEAVSYINGFCMGEQVDFRMTGPGNSSAGDNWTLRELLLETEAPSLSIGWEE
jgi:hypothetical protein